jgi:energy-converting hydrogenase B subunit D
VIVANSTVPLEALVFVLAAIAATTVVLTRNPLRQIVVNGVYGLVLAITFFVFRAPDVALSMLVVSCVAYPLVVLSAIARCRNAPEPDDNRSDRSEE